MNVIDLAVRETKGEDGMMRAPSVEIVAILSRYERLRNSFVNSELEEWESS